MGCRRLDQRRAKKPKSDWTHSVKPYGVRDENGHRVVNKSSDKNGLYCIGDVVRNKGTKCTQNGIGGGWTHLPIWN